MSDNSVIEDGNPSLEDCAQRVIRGLDLREARGSQGPAIDRGGFQRSSQHVV
jgi:hypothetical protein